MGGDPITPPTLIPAAEDEDSSSLEQDFSQLSTQLPTFLRDGLSMKVEDGTVSEKNGLVFGEFDEVSSRLSSASLDFEVNQRRKHSVYREVLQSYEELRIRSENLKEAKGKILSYTPGAWIGKVGGMKLSDYDVPKTTSLILIGPKGSGKSSLVNRISKVFEEDKFASERAQVSYNSSVGDGTYFLQEYMIPRSSMYFSLFDTRSLCDDSSDNTEMLKCWMTKGVHNGDLIIRDSDSPTLRTSMKCKVRWSRCLFSETRMVNFVIFVVNGLSILKSMDSDGDSEKKYIQTISTAFNCPYLSFKDDKPVIVVTHGDLLSLSDRARVRVHLGELLGIPPTKQIFDIPENCDPVTELTIIDMLRFSLEHADKNLPRKSWIMKMVGQVPTVPPSAFVFLLIALAIAIISAHMYHVHIHHIHQAKPQAKIPKAFKRPEINLASFKLPKAFKKPEIKWHKIRHLWLE